jgi:hypothetical protein
MMPFNAFKDVTQTLFGINNGNPDTVWHLNPLLSSLLKSELHWAVILFMMMIWFSQSSIVSMLKLGSQPILPKTLVVTVVVAEVETDVVCELVALLVMLVVALLVTVELALEVTDVILVVDTLVVCDVVALVVTLVETEELTEVETDDVPVDVTVLVSELEAVELAVLVSDVRSQPCKSPSKYKSITVFKCPTTRPQSDFTLIAGEVSVQAMSGVT